MVTLKSQKQSRKWTIDIQSCKQIVTTRTENGQDTNIKVTTTRQSQSREWTRHQSKGDKK